MFHELVSIFEPKDFVRFVAEICAHFGAYFRDAEQNSLATSAYEHCTYHKNHAYKVLAQTAETGLRHRQKTLSNTPKRNAKITAL